MPVAATVVVIRRCLWLRPWRTANDQVLPLWQIACAAAAAAAMRVAAMPAEVVHGAGLTPKVSGW